MDSDKNIDVDFEIHPPIESDHEGIATFLSKTLLHFVDCQELARHLVSLKDLTQVVAQVDTSDDDSGEEDEPDDDIYGVVSMIELPATNDKESDEHDARQALAKFLVKQCPYIKEMTESPKGEVKLGFLINERYYNLPANLSLPMFRSLTSHIKGSGISHLVFVSKVLIRSKTQENGPPKKKVKSSKSTSTDVDDEPIIYLNAEEEIFFESAKGHSDINVAANCNSNSFLGPENESKYIPHRRVIVVESRDWPKLLETLEKELK